ncbi:MAG: acylphosphatase [Candidatus Omnitrophica bacterium]|jgi:acylphosphatase|nr:acylphosphatase [Candidatus Omnitrophota bacterium]
MVKEFHLFFTGMVQGVGFRFTAKMLADRNSIKGWVKNLADGRVEVLAQGQEVNLKNFLKEVKNEFLRHINNVELEENAITTAHRNFKIEF